MQDQRKTKAQLIVELAALRARVCELEQDQRTLHPAQHTPGSVVTNGEPAQRQPADRILRNLDLDEGVLFRSSPLPMWIFDRATRRLLAANDAVIQHYGYSRDEILRMSIEDIWLLEEIPALLRQIRSPNPQLGTISGTWKHRKKDGTIIDVDVVAQAIAYDGRPAQLAVINDVTEQRRVEHMLAGQQRFFEHLASGAPLDQTLAALVQRVEAQISGGLCTVLLLDESGRHLRHAASSALPRAYIEAIDGMEIGPQAGSCGAAAYLGETVIVADIASDPLWANYRDLALAHNLRACWSAPICDSQRRVLGAFTLYYHTPHEPSAAELAQVQGAAFLASVAIERRRVEEALRTSEMRYRLVSRATNDVIWDWDIVANKTEWNEYARTLFGSDSGQAMAYPTWWDERIHPDDRERTLAGILAVIYGGGQSWYDEYRFRRTDQAYAHILDRGYIIRDDTGAPVRMIGAMQDITDRKRAEEEVRRLNAELERRVAERTAQLAAANQELEAFSYSVSHDLRAPLRSIDGFSQALLEDYADALDAPGQDYLGRVRTAAQRMGELIDDLLQLARLTRSEMRRESVDLSTLVRRIAAELRQRDPQRPVEFAITEGVVAQGDPRLLRALVENLLGNAWKFTSKRPCACITFGVAQRDGQPVYFVRDDGAGFDMAYAHKLFGAFQRLHASTEFDGTGIGLATVQRIVHRHGGRIWAEGAVDQGATFSFTLG